jgi:PKD repeat protein
MHSSIPPRRVAGPAFEVLESRLLMSVTAALEASRIEGVGPLAVHFDANKTTSTATSTPLHELDYCWDFGDDDAGTWTISGKPKDEAIGPVTGHVYDEPGTYEVTLTVTDTEGSVDTEQVTIEVQDPDVVFSGADTICFSTTGDFTGAPAGAHHVTTSDFGTVTNYAAAGKRLLLARGETWTNGTWRWLNGAGPVMFGAFGTGDKPQIVSSGGILGLADDEPVHDWRFVDLELIGPGEASADSAACFVGSGQDTLFYRVDIRNFHSGIVGYATPGQSYLDGLAIVECKIEDLVGGGGGNAMFLGATRAMILGTTIAPSDQIEHGLRTPWLQKAALSHNYFGIVASGRHQLKLHAPTWGTYGVYSEQIVLSDNVFQGGANAWSVAVAPQYSGADERIRDVIVENNLFRPGSGTFEDLVLCARQVTVRNNVFIAASGQATGITIGQRGVEPPSADVRVLNNTFLATDGLWAVAITTDTISNTTVRNNLLTPSGTMVMVYSTTTGLIESNNLTTTNPGFGVSPPYDPADFALQETSPAVGYGTTVPVFRDFTGATRPEGDAYDAGAFELQPGRLPGDATGDGSVTDADYTVWADHYGATGASFDMGDFNGDGGVTDADYTIWADHYGQALEEALTPIQNP